MNEVATIFDRKLVKRHRDRAARQFSHYDFLVRETAERIAERLEEYGRIFPVALDLGCHTGQIAEALGTRGGITTLVQSDLSRNMVDQTHGLRLVADEESLPFAAQSFDLIMSALSLHWVNDLPGTLIQIWRALKPGGLFIASLLGGNSLTELRQVMMATEIAAGQGISAHISPFIDIKDGGALIQRAGFIMPVIDSDQLTVTYENLFKLCADLRGMGETNALTARSNQFFGKAYFGALATRYAQLFPAEEARITATFDIITLTGIKPLAE